MSTGSSRHDGKQVHTCSHAHMLTHTVFMCLQMNDFFFFFSSVFVFVVWQPHLYVFAMIKVGTPASLSAVRVLISEFSLRF